MRARAHSLSFFVSPSLSLLSLSLSRARALSEQVSVGRPPIRPRSKQAEWSYKLRKSWVAKLEAAPRRTPLLAQMIDTWQVAEPNHIPGLFYGLEDPNFSRQRLVSGGGGRGDDAAADAGSGGSAAVAADDEGADLLATLPQPNAPQQLLPENPRHQQHGDHRSAIARFVDSTTVPDQDIVDLLAGCSAIVGLHPDEPTAAILDCARALGKNWAVIPCCVFRSQFPNRMVCGGFKRSANSTNYDDGDDDGYGNRCECTAVVLGSVAGGPADSEGGGAAAEEASTKAECNGKQVVSHDDLIQHLVSRGKGGQTTNLDFGGRHTVVWGHGCRGGE